MRWVWIGLALSCSASKTPDHGSRPVEPGAADTAVHDTGDAEVDTGQLDTEDVSCDEPRLDEVALWTGDDLYGEFSGEWPFALGSCGWGLAVLDLDGDGDEDLLVAGVAAPTRPLINEAGELNPGDQVRFDGELLPAGNGLSVGDFNGDGLPDVVLLRSTGLPDLVFFNLGSGDFSSTELDDSLGESQHAAPFDADGDGDLDLYVSRHIDLVATDLNALELGDLRGDANRLYLNDGGTFVLSSLDASSDAATFQAVPMDPDQDGDLDLYLVNDFGPLLMPNVLLENDGVGNFTPAPDCGCDLAMFGMGASSGDYNNDGFVDIHISDLGSPRLLMGLGDGTFVDSTLASGGRIEPSADRVTSWGTAFVDLDQNGWDDLVTVFGPVLVGMEGDWTDVVDHPSVNELDDSPIQINSVLRNTEGHFEQNAADLGFDLRGASRALVVADFDENGVPDVVVAGIEDSLEQSVRLYRGDGGCGSGITVSFPERGAADLGARVDWSVDGDPRTRWYQPGTSYSASGSTLHLGLGGHGEADWVRIHPRGGSMVEHQNVSEGARLVQRSYQ